MISFINSIVLVIFNSKAVMRFMHYIKGVNEPSRSLLVYLTRARAWLVSSSISRA